jgi:proton glutamate symport protein
LWQQIVIGAILGGILGYLSKSLGTDAKVLGDIFIRLVKMCIIPLVFPLVILGVARMNSGKALGRLAFKSILYFEVITTIIIITSVVLVNIWGPGRGANLTGIDATGIAQFADKKIDMVDYLIRIVPDNLFVAFTQQNILAILFFGAIFGFALGALKERGKIVFDLLECISNVTFKVLDYVIMYSPVGVFGFLAFSVATYGWGKLASLAELVVVVYAGLAIVWFVIFPIVAKIFGVPYLGLIKEIKDLLMIAASTRSSEVVLAPCMERLEKYGVNNSIVSFVTPLGYSFNLDGGSIYWPAAILYIANAFNMPLTIGQQVQMVLLIMVVSKGIAGVSGGHIMCLTTVCAAFGLPLEGLALILSVDFISDIARTVTNVIGNALATVAMAKTEGMFELRSEKAEQLAQ